jgi:hypothetical protein
MAGPFSDWIVRYMARRNGGISHPEQRLHALWLGAVLVPVNGLLSSLLRFHRLKLFRLD